MSREDKVEILKTPRMHCTILMMLFASPVPKNLLGDTSCIRGGFSFCGRAAKTETHLNFTSLKKGVMFFKLQQHVV